MKKSQNIITRTLWKVSFTLYSSNDGSNFWKKYQVWLKKAIFVKKQPIGKVQSFLKSKFDLYQGYKIVPTQNN